jgi:cardiolipin synthase
MSFNSDSNDKFGIYLLKKGKRGLIRALFSRIGLIIVLLALQIGLLVAIYYWFEQKFQYFYIFTLIFSLAMVLWLLNSDADPTAKITWLVFITLFPVFGSVFYLYTKTDFGHRLLKRRLEKMMASSKSKFPQNESVREKLAAIDPGAGALARYIDYSGCYPIYECEGAEYFPSGESMWLKMLEMLKSAKKFIFLEYFIIDEGEMWAAILELLAEKAKEGVDVRVLYDGTCEFTTLPSNYPERLEGLGIKCRMFAPLTPFLSTYFNYRDHRKIFVIDGQVAFTGGVNLADEYINRVEKFGFWKDAGLMVRGSAVKSFTLMFLQMWYNDRMDLHQEYRSFLEASQPVSADSRGFVIPYGDNPIDNDKLAEKVYIDILNRTRSYIHIMSPYLILDGEMELAIKFAAERGADVKLILPGTPDKFVPYALAKTHYSSLLKSGVRIYEYAPGFIHSKVFVSDDREAVVGSINLDYRSLYHHFECAAYMFGTDCISDIERDFSETLKDCREVTFDTIKNEKLSIRLTGYIMKAVAPLI